MKDQLEKNSADAVYTKDDIAMILRDAIAKHGTNMNGTRQVNLQRFEIISEILKPIEKEVSNAKEIAHAKSKRMGISFFSVIAIQFLLSQYGTYIAFSWDIMEPIMACVSLSDAIAGYFFWLWAGKPWDMNGLRSFYYDRELKRVFKKHRIDEKQYYMLMESREEIMRNLLNEGSNDQVA